MVMKRRPQIGSRVNHWFAGNGTVRRIIGHLCCVDWDRGGYGWGYVNDCKVIHA